jgi:hypothetical protein
MVDRADTWVGGVRAKVRCWRLLASDLGDASEMLTSLSESNLESEFSYKLTYMEYSNPSPLGS